MIQIHGYIERITFQNAENGFTVARLKEKGKRQLTVIVGTMPTVQAGESIQCKGDWKEDINHGLQFQVVEYEVHTPQSLQGIKKYLGSGLIKGIGPVFAERIVEYHKEKTLKVIDDQPDALLDIDGIGPVRLDRIKSCWEEQKAIRELMVFLQGYGISPTYAQKVFRTYGEKSMEVIQNNPYQLARDVWGIGFKTADVTAQKLGIGKEADIRIDSGVEYVLSKLGKSGHTCYPVAPFLDKAKELLEVPAERIEERLAFIESEDRIVIEEKEQDEAPTEFIWLKAFHASERGIIRETRRLMETFPALSFAKKEQQVQEAEKKIGIQLAPNQRAAVLTSLAEKVHIITGGPGTGKSTITRIILKVAESETTEILLAAPTGRAAKRLSEITGREASTIHSLLEYDFSISGFRRNRDNPLDCKLLIVDEASMIDTILMYSLLKAVQDETILILVGDVDQLPSVGPGNVLKDFIDCRAIPVTRLTDIFRQAAQSRIIINAHRINAGVFPDIRIDKNGDFFFIQEEEPQSIGQTIIGLVKQRLPKKYGFDTLRDIQVLSPMNRGLIGNRNLNAQLQKALNPNKDPLVKLGRSFLAGDKVMQIQNNYDKAVFNGDVGYIKKIDRIEHELLVDFEDKLVVYDFADVDQLTLAYAVSIHKYQGSECPCIVMPVHTTHYMLLFRNLLYTGITRGKRLVVLVGTKKALAMAVGNNRAMKRFTGLQWFFQA